MPEPNPEAGEVLVRVRAAGITITELQWYPTFHTRDGSERGGAVPAHEFSGEIAEVGEGVTGLRADDAVYGMNDWFAEGALAEYCITRPEWIAPKPRLLDHAAAASVPIGALTAWQGLFDRAQLRAGERVLVYGGAGAVGVYVIQLAHRHGAHVTATASAHNLWFVKSLGADEVIDYRATPFEGAVGGMDLIFDAVGGETLARSWQVLKPGGRLVTIAGEESASTDERVKHSFFIVEARRDQLVEIARLLDAGELRAVVDTVVSFSTAPEVYTGSLVKQGRGKVVVVL